MISLDFLQFDQTNLWFFALSAIGLARSRKLLPFVIVVIANLIHGTLGAAILASLVLWHRMDCAVPKWIQLKDAAALFFIFAAGVTADPHQSFFMCLGALLFSVSFGLGALGIIPALLILRQFVPHPADLEVLMGIAAFYWIAAEGIRFAKLKKEKLICATIEVICSFGILYGLKDIFLKWTDDPTLIAAFAVIMGVILVLTLVVGLKKEAFWVFYRKMKLKLSSHLTVGDRFITSANPWKNETPNEDFLKVEQSFDRLFIITLAALMMLGVLVMISRGGIN